MSRPLVYLCYLMEFQLSFLNQKNVLDKEVIYLLNFTEYLDGHINFTANVHRSGVGIEIAKNGPTIPYSMFADGCMIFCTTIRSAAWDVKTISQNIITSQDKS